MNRIVAPALLAGLLAGGSAFAAGDEFEVGVWIGGAYDDEETGEFAYCAMDAIYASGHDLVFSISAEGAFFLGLAHDDWQLEAGASYPVHLSIDDTDLGEHQVEAIDANMIGIELDYSRTTIERLRRGERLYIDTARDRLSFDLTNTYAAFPRLEQCVETSRAARGPSVNPFAPAGPGSENPFAEAAPAEGGVAYAYDEDVQLVVDMLEFVGMNEYWYVPPQDRSFAFFNDADHTWTDGDTTGAIYFFEDDGTMTPAEALTAYFEMVGAMCDGSFDYALEDETRLPEGVTLRRGFARCQEADGVVVIPTLLWNDSGTINVVSHYADEYFSARALDADERIAQFVQNLYGP